MIQLSQQTLALLDDIERRIDPESEEEMAAQWHDFLYDRFEGDLFFPSLCTLKSRDGSLSISTLGRGPSLEK